MNTLLPTQKENKKFTVKDVPIKEIRSNQRNGKGSTHWERFYQRNVVKMNSSPFARVCLKYIKDNGWRVIDVGCGNGRDSYYFAKNGVDVIGIDKYNRPKTVDNAIFCKEDFVKVHFMNRPVYARFFLHSIDNLDIVKLIEKSNNLLMLEFRNIGDKPKLYKHKRNFVDGQAIFEILVNMNFEIYQFKIGKNLARYGTENPLICRIIAKRKS